MPRINNVDEAVDAAKKFLNKIYKKNIIDETYSIEEIEAPDFTDGENWIITLSWLEGIDKDITSMLSTVSKTKRVTKTFTIDEDTGNVKRMVN